MAKNYFTDAEFTRSDTAKRLGIKNEMLNFQKANFHEMRDNVLNPFREEWGAPIIVSSGFRSVALNAAVGGVRTSAHLFGYGIDMVPSGGRSVSELFDALKWWLLRKNKRFDQLLMERNAEGTEWVHFGYRNKEGAARGRIDKINKRI